jgi:ABC-type multidrug transport system ATPase subunit
MGHSGSGKTSLLNILAGRVTTNGTISIHADIRLNNFNVDPSRIEVRKKIAFVAQDDSLQVTATPREAIKFSAKLRLPKSLTNEALDNLTERMLDELGLQSCADVLVGMFSSRKGPCDSHTLSVWLIVFSRSLLWYG